MRWLVNNREVWHSDNKYRIKWDKKAPSKGAQAVKDFIYQNCRSLIWYEEYRLPSCLLRVDFLCSSKSFALEFQGPQHETFNKHFHENRNGFLQSIKRDIKKEKILNANGYTLIEIFEKDLPLTRKFFLDKYQIII